MGFVEFLTELERNHQTIVVSRDEVERLVSRFGAVVRQMGVWHHGSDGSLEVAAADLAAAARTVGDAALSEAVRQLQRPEEFAGVLDDSCAAARLIAELARLYRQRFEEKVRRYQDTQNPAEVNELAKEISQELFGA